MLGALQERVAELVGVLEAARAVASGAVAALKAARKALTKHRQQLQQMKYDLGEAADSVEWTADTVTMVDGLMKPDDADDADVSAMLPGKEEDEDASGGVGVDAAEMDVCTAEVPPQAAAAAEDTSTVGDDAALQVDAAKANDDMEVEVENVEKDQGVCQSVPTEEAAADSKPAEDGRVTGCIAAGAALDVVSSDAGDVVSCVVVPTGEADGDADGSESAVEKEPPAAEGGSNDDDSDDGSGSSESAAEAEDGETDGETSVKANAESKCEKVDNSDQDSSDDDAEAEDEKTELSKMAMSPARVAIIGKTPPMAMSPERVQRDEQAKLQPTPLRNRSSEAGNAIFVTHASPPAEE